MSARALLASFAVFLAMPSIIAASDEKNKTPEKTSEEVILERIDQLQSQLNELRAALAAQRTVNAPFSAPASASSAVSEAVATAADQQTPREPKSGLRPSAEPEKREPAEPFAFADFTWLTGNPRTKESPLETKAFTGEFRADVDFVQDLNHPQDHSIGGSSEVFRANEVQVTQLGIGGDFHYNNVRGRLMTQFGMYSSTTPRNDASPARGQWDLDTAYRYVSEAYGGYHINKLNGINIDAGIFMSYVGLDSYYQFDNWVYQPSYVSSNTPWFFNGVRIQIFPSTKLKIEPWIVNGWQSYGKFNEAPGVGLQVLWRPNGSVSILGNQYYGTDTLGNPNRKRFHTDDSIQLKYLDRPGNGLDKAAFTVTVDLGCEWGGGVSCRGGSPAAPSQYFLGFMAYNRFWFKKDLFGLTLGGGAISNPGRYLVLLPPINGATNQRHALFHRKSRRQVSRLGRFSHLRLHAQPVRHVPLGIQSPRGQCAVFLRLRRDHASRRQRGAAGFVRPGLDTGSSQIRESFHSGAAGEIVIS